MLKLSQIIRIIAVPVLAVTALSSGPTVHAQDKAQDVADRCVKAYKALSSYSGTTTVSTTVTGLGAGKYNTSATILYQKTGKLRVDGSSMFKGTYSLVSDGVNIWLQMKPYPGKWDKQPNMEAAVAMVTGISNTAATNIPAALLGLKFGTIANNKFKGSAAVVTLNGKKTYKITSTFGLGTTTLWIDAATMLMVKCQSHMSMSMQASAKQPGGSGNTMVRDSTETYTKVQTNTSIPAAKFQKPAGAP